LVTLYKSNYYVITYKIMIGRYNAIIVFMFDCKTLSLLLRWDMAMVRNSFWWYGLGLFGLRCKLVNFIS